MISGLRGSSRNGRGRAGGSASDTKSDPESMGDSAVRSGSTVHNSTTDCSTQWRRPELEQGQINYQEGKSVVQWGMNAGERLGYCTPAKLFHSTAI